MGSYTWICLALFYICVTKTVQGHVWPETSHDDIKSVFKEQNKKISELETILGGLREQVDEHSNKIVALEKNVADKNKEILELKGNLESNKQLKKDINDKMFELEERNLASEQAWEEKFEKHDGDISILKARLEFSEQDNEEQSKKIPEKDTMLLTRQQQGDEQNSEVSKLERKIVMYEEICRESFSVQDNKTSRLEEELHAAKKTCQENVNQQKDQVAELVASLQSQEEVNEQKFKSQTNETDNLREEVRLRDRNLRRMIRVLNHKSNDHQIYFSARVSPPYSMTKSMRLSDYPIRFKETISNNGNCYNTTTHIFTATIAGIYVFSYHVDNSKHESHWLTVYSSINRSYHAELVILHLNKGDEVYVRGIYFSTSTIISATSWFSGFLLKAD